MKLIKLCAALAVATVTASVYAAPAHPAIAATVFDFSNLEYNHNTNTGFLPSEVLGTGYWKCTGGDLCSSNLAAGKLGGDLKYTVNGITATATGFYKKKQVTVLQDHDNGWNAKKHIGAGLGVYHLTNDNSDDNITVGETLKLSFNRAVTLSGLSLRADGHTGHFDKDSTFLLDGHSMKLSQDIDHLALTGTEFSFAFGGREAEQFYLGGVTVTGVSPVPEPATTGMMLAGLGLLGWMARRRKNLP